MIEICVLLSAAAVDCIHSNPLSLIPIVYGYGGERVWWGLLDAQILAYGVTRSFLILYFLSDDYRMKDVVDSSSLLMLPLSLLYIYEELIVELLTTRIIIE